MRSRIIKTNKITKQTIEYSTEPRLNKLIAEIKDKNHFTKSGTMLVKERAAYPNKGWVTETSVFTI